MVETTEYFGYVAPIDDKDRYTLIFFTIPWPRVALLLHEEKKNKKRFYFRR